MRTIIVPVALIILSILSTIAYAACPSGMVGYWPLNETSGTTAADVIGGSTGTLTNGPVWNASGVSGGSLMLDGTDDYVVSQNNVGITGTASRTATFWFKPADAQGRQDLFGWGASGTGNRFSLIFDFASCPDEGLFFSGYAADACGSGGTVGRNIWTFAAVTYDGTTVKVYINGAPTPDITYTYALTTQDSPVNIGKNVGDGTYFKGDIDEFAVYNSALSASELSALYAKGQYHHVNYCEALPSPAMAFVSPTPANGATTTNTSILVKSNLTSATMKDFIWGWNGTNYTIHNDSLLVMYNFDDYTRLNETSSYHRLTACGSGGCPTYTSSGAVGGAYYFSGADDSLIVAYTTGVNPRSAISYSLWIKPSVGGGNVFGKGSCITPANQAFGTHLSGPGLFGVQVDSAGFNDYLLYSPSSIVDGTWKHIVATYDSTLGSNQVKMYINGELVAQAGSGGGLLQAAPIDFRIGDTNDCAGSFQGYIDEPRIWDRALSAAEAREQYRSSLNKYAVDTWQFSSNQSGLAVGTYTYQTSANTTSGAVQTGQRTLTVTALCGNGIVQQGEQCDDGNTADGDCCSSTCQSEAPAGMVSYWRLNDATGTTAADVIGGNTGTLTNGPVWTTGKIGNALSFDGVDDYARFSDNPDITNAATLSMWIYPRTFGNYNAVVGAWDYSASKRKILMEFVSGQLRFYVSSDGSQMTYRNAGVAVNLNEWTHISGVYSGEGILDIYVNGVLSNNNLVSTIPSSLYPGVVSFGIGADNFLTSSAEFFDGSIDEVAMYNRALTAGEAAALYYGSGNLSASYCAIAPAATGFDAGSTDLGAVADLTNVTNLTLVKSGAGRVRWPGNANVVGANLSQNVLIGRKFISVDSAGLDASLNASALITLDGIDCATFDRNLLSYREGAFSSAGQIAGTTCPLDVCTDVVCTGTQLNFTVSHFTGYAYGNNASLIANDTTESLTVYASQAVEFFGHYVNSTSGEPITSSVGQCNVTIPDLSVSNVAMTYDAPNGRWKRTQAGGFPAAGVYSFTVNCTSTLFNDLNAADTTTITAGSPGLTTDVPEFGTWALLAALGLVVAGVASVRRKA